MKQLFLFLFCSLVGLTSSAQDILKMKNGEELQIKVLKVTPSFIEYSYPNEAAVIQIQRKKVSRILYESGRVEEFEKHKEGPEDIKEQKGNKLSARRERIKQLYFCNPLGREQMFYVKAGIALNKIQFYDDKKLMGISGGFEESKAFRVGEALDLGYSHYIKHTRFYWATELGLTTRGCYYDLGEIYLADMDDVSIDGNVYLIHHGVKMSPAIFGYRFLLPHEFAVDLRLGGYFTYYYAGKMSGTMLVDDYTEGFKTPTYTWKNGDNDYYATYFNKQNRFNADIETGIALWYKRFCFDFTYNMGFVSFEKLPPVQPSGMSYEDYCAEILDHPSKYGWEVRNKNLNYNFQFKLGIAF